LIFLRSRRLRDKGACSLLRDVIAFSLCRRSRGLRRRVNRGVLEWKDPAGDYGIAAGN
jgi:hypothetical protein